MNAVRAHGLSKQYRLGETDFGRGSLYEAMASRLLLRNADHRRSRRESIWALADVSFEIQAGEGVGVIGANGAGKSTLLKILSRITPPTRGHAAYYGRLASLLEVGTGFHPELTGRDNVYLNGAILGMSRREIARKFDEIVDFAGIPSFLDTPVKRYSSGMQVRLAFAVAAHIDPDILVVDEVLAVGDASFREKSLRKMEDSARSGRTVILVSHDLAAIEGMTTRCLLLDKGRLVADGPTADVIRQYLGGLEKAAQKPIDDQEHRGSGGGRIRDVRVTDADGIAHGFVATGSEMVLDIAVECHRHVAAADLHVGVYDHLGRNLTVLAWDTTTKGQKALARGSHRLSCMVRRLPLLPGKYSLNVAFMDGAELLDVVVHCLTFAVEPGDFFGTGRLPRTGAIAVDSEWQALAADPTRA